MNYYWKVTRLRCSETQVRRNSLDAKEYQEALAISNFILLGHLDRQVYKNLTSSAGWSEATAAKWLFLIIYQSSYLTANDVIGIPTTKIFSYPHTVRSQRWNKTNNHQLISAAIFELNSSGHRGSNLQCLWSSSKSISFCLCNLVIFLNKSYA